MLTHTHKKKTKHTHPNNTSSRHRKKEKEQWTSGKCNRSLRTVLKSNITPVGAGMKLTGGDKSDRTGTEHELGETKIPCWRLCLSLSPLTQTLLTFYPEAPQKKKKSLMLSHWNASLPDQEGEKNRESPP